MLKIKELRKEKNITQSQLAEILSTTTANVSGWETEKWQPDIVNLIKMSEIFECTIDYLVGRESENGIIYSSNNLTEDEKLYINLFRNLKISDKKILLEIAKILQNNH